MLASQRQEAILAEVTAHGAVRVTDLVERFDVSDMTIRRDISELAARGLVRRVHGGAVSAHGAALPTAHEPRFAAKRELAGAEKRAIAAAAAATLEPGESVALSAGTTTYALALLLAERRDLRPLTVVTNSLPVADALHSPADHELTVVLTGGTRTPSDALVGPVAVAALADLRVDRLFLGVHGMDPRAGLTTPNLQEAETNRALVAAAGSVTVVADHTKWGVVGLSRIADLGEVDVLVSDGALAGDAREDALARVGRLVLAEPAPAGPAPAGPAPAGPVPTRPAPDQP